MRAYKRSVALGAALTGLAVHAAPSLARQPWGQYPFPVLRRAESDRMVGLTFDDGPDERLDGFLRALEDAGARATFFLVGEQVERAPSGVGEIVACGHEVAVHCYRHRNHLGLTPWRTLQDMRAARYAIETAAGREPKLYRPPYGVFNMTSWLEADRQGWKRVLWNRWGKDWEARATPQTITTTIGIPRPGDILLLHDSDRYSAHGSWRKTLCALPAILDAISARDCRACSVSELLEQRCC